MKKLLALLLLSPLVVNASVAEYCMEKYPPEKSKDKFVQCIEDGMEFKKNSETIAKPDTNSYSISSHHKYDFLSDGYRKTLNPEDKKIIDGAYNEFLSADGSKAFALEINNKGEPEGAYGYCVAKQNIRAASECAVNSCIKYKSKGTICLAQYENYNYVLEEGITKFTDIIKKFGINPSSSKQAKPKSSNGIDWERMARAAAPIFNNNPAFGGTPPTKICNFKNFNGQIISGDCSKFSITIGNDTYRKVK